MALFWHRQRGEACHSAKVWGAVVIKEEFKLQHTTTALGYAEESRGCIATSYKSLTLLQLLS